MKKDHFLRDRSRELRTNMTKTERLLWLYVSRKQLLGYRFRRQAIVGTCIVDFYCPKAKLIIELDGRQHFSEEAEHRDRDRDKYLNDLGFRVFRFGNDEVWNNKDSVLQIIIEALENPDVSLNRLPNHPEPATPRGDGGATNLRYRRYSY